MERERVRVRDTEGKRKRNRCRDTERGRWSTPWTRHSGHRGWSQSRGLCLWEPGGDAAGHAASLTGCPVKPWGPGSPRSPCVGGRRGMELTVGGSES